jgi:hypothetical protein
MKTLTRRKAHELVDAAYQLGALSFLVGAWDPSQEWINIADPPKVLHEYVDACASGADPDKPRKPGDDTGLPTVKLL